MYLRLMEPVKKKGGGGERKLKRKKEMKSCYNTLDKTANKLIDHIIIYSSHIKVLFVPVSWAIDVISLCRL